MSRWRRVVRRELSRYRDQTGYDVFDLEELYDQLLPVLRSEYPDNDHPAAKLRQILQQLRDRGELEFVDDRGTYRILSLADTTEEGAETGTPVEYEVAEYETTVGARSMPVAFRRAVLESYGRVCPVSGVDHERLLDVAHVLAWNDHPDHRADPENVLPLSKTHHAAFDAGLFTVDREFTLHVAPSFETDSDVLRETLVAQEGTRLAHLDETPLAGEYLERHNDVLDWW